MLPLAGAEHAHEQCHVGILRAFGYLDVRELELHEASSCAGVELHARIDFDDGRGGTRRGRAREQEQAEDRERERAISKAALGVSGAAASFAWPGGTLTAVLVRLATGAPAERLASSARNSSSRDPLGKAFSYWVTKRVSSSRFPFSIAESTCRASASSAKSPLGDKRR